MGENMLETYVVHVTKECNMNCTYCYEQDKTSTYTWEEVRSTLDDIVKYNKHFTIEFLGGEPLLAWDNIRQSIDYLESFGDVNVERYTITTNGTVMCEEIAIYMMENPKVSWAASIDGNKFMNFMRTFKNGAGNSYDEVISKLNFLKEFGVSDDQISCHLVTHPYNIGYFVDGMDDLYNKGFRHFGIGTVESIIVIDEQYCREFVRQHMILSDRMRQGKYPDMTVDLFNGVKSKDDGRHYIRDDEGKVILETYGRADNDIKDSEEHKTPSSSSPLGDTIYNIRLAVYTYHNR